MKLTTSIVCAAILSAASFAANAVIINHNDRGWWNTADNSNNGIGPNNTYTGKNGVVNGSDVFRSYFTFDVSGVAGSVVGGTLNLELEQYFGDGASESFDVFDVSTAFGTLTGAGSAPGVYADLGSGALYGSATVTAADQGSIISIALSGAAIADINASGGQFAVGLSHIGSNLQVTNDGVRFSIVGEPRSHTLDLTVRRVPEPTTMALLGLGLLAGARRRR